MATQQEKSNNLSNKPSSIIMSPTSDPEEPSKKQNAVMEWLLGKLLIHLTAKRLIQGVPFEKLQK